MGRAPCCDKGSVKKGPWSPEEDRKLKEYIDKYGTGGNWIALPTKAGLRRCGKSCRLRWLNYLRPNIKHGDFSDHEDRIICNLFATIGSRWSIIAAQLPGRTDNDIKNYWNTKLKKKLMGLPPTHRSKPPATENHHHQLFFPADPPALADAAIPAPQHHPFSLQHLGAAPHYSSSYSPSCSSLPTAGGGGSLLMFGSGGDQYQHHMSSCASDNGGLYFELCNNSSGSMGLESFIFGGLQLQEDTSTQAKLFPAHNNTSGSMLEMDHRHQYGGSSSSSSNSNSNAASCYEHEMKPLPMILPSGSGTSSFFYGEAAGASQGRFLY